MSNQLANSGFNVSINNMNEAMQMATMISNSQLAPQAYKGKADDTLVAMMMGNELGLNPMQSIQNIAVINGKPSIYGDAMLALVQNHPAFGGINESYDEATKTATCVVWRKCGDKHTQTFSKHDADAAGLWGRKGPWTQYPQRMLSMRARGFALRNQFADALCGLISAEEAQDMPAAVKDITPANAPENLAIYSRIYISSEQAKELEDMAAPISGLIEKIKKAYQLNALTDLETTKLDECKQRIMAYVDRQNANNQ